MELNHCDYAHIEDDVGVPIVEFTIVFFWPILHLKLLNKEKGEKKCQQGLKFRQDTLMTNTYIT